MAKDERTNLALHVFPEIGRMSLSQIGASDGRGVLEACVKKGLRKGTITHVRGVMYRVLKSAWRDDLVPSNVIEKVAMPKLREAKKERAILTDEEIARYLACPDVDLELRLMSLVARVEGGMRTGDVNRWDWAMIDLVHLAECIVPRAKTNKPQHLAIPDVLAPMLRQRWEDRGRPRTGPVFPVRRGPRAGEFKAPRGISYAKALRRDLLRAGVIRHTCTRPANGKPVQIGEECCVSMAHDPLFTETPTTRPVDFHSFRRGFSTALASAGVNSQQAMRLASHSDEKTHMRYVMQTDAMKQIPSGAIPRLPSACFTNGHNPCLLPKAVGGKTQQSRWAKTDLNRQPTD
jgi:integrase